MLIVWVCVYGIVVEIVIRYCVVDIVVVFDGLSLLVILLCGVIDWCVFDCVVLVMGYWWFEEFEVCFGYFFSLWFVMVL